MLSGHQSQLQGRGQGRPRSKQEVPGVGIRTGGLYKRLRDSRVVQERAAGRLILHTRPSDEGAHTQLTCTISLLKHVLLEKGERQPNERTRMTSVLSEPRA